MHRRLPPIEEDREENERDQREEADAERSVIELLVHLHALPHRIPEDKQDRERLHALVEEPQVHRAQDGRRRRDAAGFEYRNGEPQRAEEVPEEGRVRIVGREIGEEPPRREPAHPERLKWVAPDAPLEHCGEVDVAVRAEDAEHERRKHADDAGGEERHAEEQEKSPRRAADEQSRREEHREERLLHADGAEEEEGGEGDAPAPNPVRFPAGNRTGFDFIFRPRDRQHVECPKSPAPELREQCGASLFHVQREEETDEERECSHGPPQDTALPGSVPERERREDGREQGEERRPEPH